jgi:hypothetical protein
VSLLRQSHFHPEMTPAQLWDDENPLHKLDEPSLSSLIQDHAAGKLEQICRDNTA